MQFIQGQGLIEEIRNMLNTYMLILLSLKSNIDNEVT